MDPKTYCEQAISAQRRRPARRAEVLERSQLTILLTHFARFGPPDGDAFARASVRPARSWRTGRRGGRGAEAPPILVHAEPP